MFVDFESLDDNARIWIYQSNREFSDVEVESIVEKLTFFIQNWKRHGDDLKASFKIMYNQFVIIAVDESFNNVSGCSIDASIHTMQQIEKEFGIELMDKMKIAFKNGKHINITTMADFQKFAKENKVDKNTIVFNNMVQTKKELATSWEIAANQSWHQRYFN